MNGYIISHDSILSRQQVIVVDKYLMYCTRLGIHGKLILHTVKLGNIVRMLLICQITKKATSGSSFLLIPCS